MTIASKTKADPTYRKGVGSRTADHAPRGIVSLFSGAGGLDVGFSLAGLEPDICFEWDSDAVETLKHNHPKVNVIKQDINALAASENIEAEVRRLTGFSGKKFLAVIGGPPCQAFSTAGHRLGMNDPRGRLVLSYLEIVDALRPEFCVFENVRGITSMHIDPQEKASLPLVDYIVNYLEGLGYQVSSDVINAADYGVAQKRERFVLIGCLSKKVSLPLRTHAKAGDLSLKPWVSLGDAIRPLERVPSLCANLSP